MWITVWKVWKTLRNAENVERRKAMINGFFGEDRHSVDGKGRVFIPVGHRDLLQDTFIMMRDTDKCVKIYTADRWNQFTEKLSQFPDTEADRLRRVIYSNTFRAELDSSGRVLIPEKLRQYASISKNVVIVGMNTRVEIWDEETWNEYYAKQNEEEMFNERLKFGL